MTTRDRDTLSVLVNTLNEAAMIGDCLRSVTRIADEIVVVDTGSSDDTCEIASRAGATVYHHAPVRVVEQARDASLARCTCGWVLILDADERIPESLGQWITDFLASPARHAVRGVAFPRRARFFGGWLTAGSWWPAYQVRLVRRGAGRYGTESIHAQPLPIDGAGVLRVPAETDLAIEHHAYTTIDAFVRRSLSHYTEVERDLEKHRAASGSVLLWVGLRRLLVELVWKRGYRDGTRGVVVAGLLAAYDFLNRAKAWERELGRDVHPTTSKTPQGG
jgi:glycosyltransferase involved in cell wall biosynthesis